MLEFLDTEWFDKILELLIKNQKVKTSCYANKTCLSIRKEHQINIINTTDQGIKIIEMRILTTSKI